MDTIHLEQQEGWQTDQASSSMAMNSVLSQQNNNPTLWI
jgi:hypothetical protein